MAPLPGRLRPPKHLPDIVFSDLLGIPLGPDSREYWGVWRTPHLFYYAGTDDSLASDENAAARVPPAPPRGWTSRSVCLSHAATGGSTSGRWCFGVWYPPGYPWVERWSPLRGNRGTAPHCCVVSTTEYWLALTWALGDRGWLGTPLRGWTDLSWTSACSPPWIRELWCSLSPRGALPGPHRAGIGDPLGRSHSLYGFAIGSRD